MNQKTLNIIYGIVIVALVGTVVYFAMGKKSEPVAQKPPQTPIETPVSSQTPATTPVDETASWKTYTNTTYGFELKYPADMNAEVKSSQPDLVVAIAASKYKYSSIEIRTRSGISGSLAGYSYLDFAQSGKSTMGNQEAATFTAPGGYCDGSSCGDPFIAYVTKKGNIFYHLIFYGDDAANSIELEVLKSFRFTK